MTRNRASRRASVALLAVLILPACAVFKKQVPLTPEQSYERGMAAHAAGQHGRAAQLLGTWVQANAGDPRLPTALLALARSHLERRDWVTASSEFLRVVTDFPQSPEQREARFGICDAYHRLSPKPPLDQEYTRAGVAYCDSYAQYYPDTPEAPTARQWVGEMRGKLAEKEYLNGMFYFRRQAYDAAVIYFNDAATGFPETAWAPAALLKVVESYEKIGYKEEAEEARTRLRTQFPESQEARSLAAAAPATPPS
jgi:outer membrane protein assembly factor BamD